MTNASTTILLKQATADATSTLKPLQNFEREWTQAFWAKGDVKRDDSHRRFLAQHIVAMLEQCWNYSKQCCNNVVTLCCAKNRRCESSRMT